MTRNSETSIASFHQENVLKVLHRAVRAKDTYTAEHNQRVSMYAVNLAQAIGLDSKSIATIGIGGQLHDVGKIGISDAVLLKPTKLSPHEFQEIQQHCSIGREICEPLTLDPLALNIVHHHHERLDGSGYPDGLRGTQIPLEVQVVSVTDVVDALITNRVYRSACSIEEVWNILYDEAKQGLHDVHLVSECIRIMASKQIFSSAKDLCHADETLSNETNITMKPIALNACGT